MKMYADYISERLGREILLYDGLGFGTFKIEGDDCYIVDIFVEPGARQGNVATSIADDIKKIALERGCKTLTGSVDLKANNPHISMQALLGYRMKPVSALDHFIIFKKDISNG
jgi:hypothetical protein